MNFYTHSIKNAEIILFVKDSPSLTQELGLLTYRGKKCLIWIGISFMNAMPPTTLTMAMHPTSTVSSLVSLVSQCRNQSI